MSTIPNGLLAMLAFFAAPGLVFFIFAIWILIDARLTIQRGNGQRDDWYDQVTDWMIEEIEKEFSQEE